MKGEDIIFQAVVKVVGVYCFGAAVGAWLGHGARHRDPD